MVDTGEALRRARNSQGCHEAEISFKGEADLHEHETNCQKNPGHLNFKPVDKFTAKDLPKGYQSNIIAACVMALSCLTVRLKASLISDSRPVFYEGTNKEYPFSEFKGEYCLRVGSGWVRQVSTSFLKDDQRCLCKKCVEDSQIRTHLVEIVVRTAAHVIYDIREAKDTICHLFFDREGAPEFCEGAVELSNAVSVVCDPEGDWCDLVFVTHNKKLGLKLENLLQHYYHLHQKVWDSFPANSTIELDNTVSELNLAVVVSHPHGCSKQISAGCFQKREITQSEGSFTTYTYTAATCAGSSGAPVFILGPSRRWSWCSHPHSGCDEVLKEFSYSGVGAN